MARWIRRVLLLALAAVGLLALLLWWWLRRRPEEEVILRTKLGTITRVRGIGKLTPFPPEAAEPAEVSDVEGPAPPETAEPAQASHVEKTAADDLKRIAGIGPKIADVLQAAGIETYAQLASTDVERLEQILGGADIRLADPGTWPEQAGLAAAGDWDALERLQSQLKGGRRV